jgi:hypothetical protein
MAQEEDVLNLYDDDAKKLNEHHYKSQQTAKDSFNHAFEAGRILAEVKDRLPHGKFTAWVKARFEGSSRTARLYMQVHRAVSTGAVPKPDGSAWGYSLSRLVQAAREQDAEPEPEEPAAPCEPAPPAFEADYEPEVDGEEYMFDEEEYKKYFGEDGPADRDEEHEADPTPQGSEQKPARKRDLETSAFSAINRFIHEVPGEEKDRIQATRERLDMEESALLALASEEGCPADQ